MSETRKNHLAIDGAQVKDDEHTASYKPIPEADSELRASKPSLLKSKEKLSPDGAEEKLLQKEDEAKITTRVDMADAKYVVGDHRNGDAKIELDANKRQFSGLTKEELLKYADDPFWVRLRWVMFALFWVLWLAMLTGAIAIIVTAPKCAPPPPKTWFQKGPLIESSQPLSSVQEVFLKNLQTTKAQGIFVAQDDAYRVLDDAGALDELKALVEKAKSFGVKVIVDLTASFVSTDHPWFQQALNNTGEYANYFIWGNPNNSVSEESQAAWVSAPNGKFYYQVHGVDKPQLNLRNAETVRHFDDVLKKYMALGIGGVRLVNSRELLVDASLVEETARPAQNSSSKLALLEHWAHVVKTAAVPAIEDSVFTIAEAGELGFLRPPFAPPASAGRAAADVAADLNKQLKLWPAIELTLEGEPSLELASFAALLPAAPVLQASLFTAAHSNDSDSLLGTFGRLLVLRSDASIEHGNSNISAVPALNSSEQLLVCARWKPGHTGYAAVWNPSSEEARADLTSVPSLPRQVTLHHVSPHVKALTNYTMNEALESDNIRVPARSTVVLSYVPKTTVES